MFDFAANRTVATLAGVVPDQFHCFYKEAAAGGFELSGEPQVVVAVATIAGQSTALTASRAEAKDAKGKMVDLSPLAEYGADPTAIAATFKTRSDEYTEQIAKGKGADLDLAKLKEAMGEEHSKQIFAKDGVIKNLEGQIHRELVTNRATAAIIAAKGNPLLLMPHLNNSVQTVMNESGEAEVHIVDQAGARRFSGHTAEHMTIDELVTEMKGKPEYGVCFESDAPAGGGAPPTGGAPPRAKPSDMNSTDKIAAGLDQLRR